MDTKRTKAVELTYEEYQHIIYSLRRLEFHYRNLMEDEYGELLSILLDKNAEIDDLRKTMITCCNSLVAGNK